MTVVNNDIKLVMTLCVRDEEDILENNIEFHRALGVDHFIITDNLSVDRTVEIIDEYVAKGLATKILEPRDDYNQSEWVTRMARIASIEFGADWVINNDADEFWFPSCKSLKLFFQSLSDEVNVVSVKRRNFISSGSSNIKWYEDMIYKEQESFNHIGKPLPPKVAHRGHPEIIVEQGNHKVLGFGDEVLNSQDIEILHFPMRTQQQFENKIVKGGAAYERNTEIPVTMGRGWRRLYDKYKENGNLDDYWQENCLGEDLLREGLESQTIVKDIRLVDFFNKGVL